jgi:Tfp pilus assembly protein PilX
MKRKAKKAPSVQRSRGIALVITLLLLALFSIMTLAMVISTTSDLLIDGYYRNYRSAFYAADSGVNTVREYMLSQIQAAVPSNFNISSGAPIPASIAGPTGSITNAVTNTSTGFGSYQSITGTQTASWPSSFEVDTNTANTYLGVPTCTVTYTGSGTTAPTCAALGSSGFTVTAYKYSYPYKITAIGQARVSATHKVEEDGYLNITVDVGTPYGQNLSFAAYGMFIDQYSICSGSALVPGTVTGPVFTNGSWTFGTSGAYIFTDAVGSAGSNFGYAFGSCYQSPNHSYTSGSQTINPTFQGSVTLGAPQVALPQNSFGQMRSVLDGMGTNTLQPTSIDKNLVLRDVTNTPYPLLGASSGVYLPYTPSPNGSSCPTGPCMTGGGIYVEGNADSVTMSAATSGGHSQQVFAIKQGSTTTTVTLDLTASTTTISNGSTTRTVNGLPQNMNSIPSTEACMLYVNGNISGTSGSTTTGLSGPSSGAAIQDGSAVTVTAAQNISITGNITYQTEPVTLNTADTLVAGGNKGQVLGIFTPGGNVNLAMPSAGGNLEIDAAIATISQGGSGAITNTGNAINQLTIVGGRMQNTIQNINTTNRSIFYDRRFSQGSFAPPWFPSTTITSNGVVNAVVVVSPPTRLSWTDLSAM